MWGQPRNPFGGDLIPPIDLGVPPLQMPPIMPASPMAAAVQAKPHGFLREGGPGRTIIGIIADALAGATGGQGTYAPLMLQKRRQQMLDERDIREEERKARAPIRSQIGDDYVEIDPTTGTAKVLYRGTSTKAPYRWETNDGSLAELGPNGQPRIIYKDPTPKVDYVEATDPVTGAKSYVPRTLGGAAKAPPAVGEVRNGYRFNGGDPADPKNYVQVGGPTPQASGTFR